MNLATGPEVARVMCQYFGIEYHPCRNAVARIDPKTEEILCGIVIDTYKGPGGCAIIHNFIGKHKEAVTRNYIQSVFHYLFCQLECSVVYGYVHTINQAAIDFNKRIGFTVLTTLENYYPDGDSVLFQMFKKDCKWLPKPQPLLKVAA